MTDVATLPGTGVHDLTDAEYFDSPLAHASLSSTGVRELLVCPAKFRHRQQHTRPDTRAFDIGHAAHQLLLGAGPELVLFPGTGANPEAWQKADDKEQVAAMRAAGKVPLRPSDWAKVHAMADAIEQHPHAPKLLTRGKPEQTLIWEDEATGVLCRAKADLLRHDGIVDYKTCDNASGDSLVRSVWNYGYAVQAAFYLRGFRAVLPVEVPFFAFIAQEKEAPYLTQVFQLSERALAYGDRKCAEALELYARCTAAGEWPGYPSDEIAEIDLPAYVRTEEY